MVRLGQDVLLDYVMRTMSSLKILYAYISGGARRRAGTSQEPNTTRSKPNDNEDVVSGEYDKAAG